MKLNIFNKSKILSPFLILIIILHLISACEKVIDIDLNSNSSQIVIEGNITDQAGPYIIKLTQSVNYNEINYFPPISEATVIISDDAGSIDTLHEVSQGIYITSTIQGTPGRTYSLKVNANGMEYTATSFMNPPVNIDSIYSVVESLPNGSKKTLYVKYTDTEGINNFYRFVEVVNNDTLPSIFIADDLEQDGEIINLSLFSRGQDESDLETGDTVTVLLQTLDKNVYEYYRTLLQLSSGGIINQSTSPSNPLSNFNNGALGYLNTCAVTSKSIVIP
ncbi:MAG: DUF4249 domain-containing protein [Salinivirgaceae bacterium]|jgi:hypothetical protein